MPNQTFRILNTHLYARDENFLKLMLKTPYASNQTGHKYSLAYAYTYYWDRIKTSQPTGTFAVQNRFIHDMEFMPDKWVATENPHVPMRDAKGGQYLFLEGQSIKPAKPFVEVSMNPSLFY